MALLKFKRSAVPAKVPALNDLALGELAINTYDGKVYTKKDDGTPAIVQVGGGGGVQTITSSDGSVTVTGTTDINLSVATAGATNTLLLPVRNNTGATLAKGTAVYINGALGQNPTVTKAIATGDATSAQTLGLVTANIANNSVGNVTLIGSLTNLDTSAYSDGAQLYLSPTTAGALTATKPYAPNHLVYMAVVEHAHPTLGKLFVKVQNGYEMDELHNVAAQSPANNDGLFYNTSTSLWEKKSIVTALGYTPYNATNPNGYISGITSGMVTGALGYTPYNATNPAGYITGITSGNVTTALGYTPANRAGDTFTGAVGFAGGVYNNVGGSPFFANAGGVNWLYSTAAGLRVRNAADSATILDLTNSGSLTANVDFRAPIFYDSNDTAYYADFAGSTAIFSNGVIVAGTQGFQSRIVTVADRNRIWSFNNADAFGLSYFQGTAGTGGASTIGLHFGTATAAASTLQVVANAYTLSLGSMRAPIFYDSDNTAYYVDAAAATSLRTVGDWRSDSGAWTGEFNGKIQYHANNWYFQSANTWEFRRSDSLNAFTVSQGGVAEARADFRAPVFYDSNNTGYYLDPSDTSMTNGMRASVYRSLYGGGQPAARWDTSFYVMQSQHWYSHTGAMTMYVGESGDFVYIRGYTQAEGSSRAPIFYDSNNTGYYVDPLNGSVLNRLVSITGAGNANGGNLQLGDKDVNTVKWSVLTGAHYGGSSEPKGVMLIGSYSASGNNSLSIGGNVYEANPATYIAFYTATTGTHPTGGSNRLNINGSGNVTAEVDIRSPIYYDSNNTAFYVDPATGSSFSGATFSDLITGRSSPSTDVNTANDTGSISIRGSTTTVAAMSFHRTGAYAMNMGLGTDNVFRIGGWSAQSNCLQVFGTGVVQALNDFRAPLFYDSNNTGYYLDPNNTSNLAGLTVGNRISGSVTGCTFTQDSQDQDNITLRTDSGFYQSSSATTAEGWPVNSGSWQHMISCTHTNDGNYYAMQLGSTFFDQGLFYRVTGGSGTTGWSRVALYDNDYSGTLRATIFYDVSNTAYYLDAASTGTSLNVAGNIIAAGNVTAYSDIRVKANVETIPSALDKLDQIRGVTYTRIDLEDKEQRYAGVIAQEIEGVLPEAVRDLGNIKAVDYNATIALLIEAVKELSLKVKTLEEKDN